MSNEFSELMQEQALREEEIEQSQILTPLMFQILGVEEYSGVFKTLKSFKKLMPNNTENLEDLKNSIAIKRLLILLIKDACEKIANSDIKTSDDELNILTEYINTKHNPNLNSRQRVRLFSDGEIEYHSKILSHALPIHRASKMNFAVKSENNSFISLSSSRDAEMLRTLMCEVFSGKLKVKDAISQ